MPILVPFGCVVAGWNARSQLTGITGPVTASFAYDPFGRREQATIGNTTTSYLYDGANVTQELSGGTPTVNYLLGLGIGQRYSRTDTGGTQNYLTDALGSTIALADSTGTVHTSYTYDPFGQATTSGTASSNTYQYTGGPADPTGLQYNLTRYYNPAHSQFSSQDQLGLAGSGTNPYLYAGGNPVNYTDPTGQASVKAVLGLILGILALATAILALVVDPLGEIILFGATALVAGLAATSLDFRPCMGGDNVACYGLGLGGAGALAGTPGLGEATLLRLGWIARSEAADAITKAVGAFGAQVGGFGSALDFGNGFFGSPTCPN